MIAERQAALAELRRRVVEEAGLARPVPAVSPSIALLLADLIAELGACVSDLEYLRDLLDTRLTA